MREFQNGFLTLQKGSKEKLKLQRSFPKMYKPSIQQSRCSKRGSLARVRQIQCVGLESVKIQGSELPIVPSFNLLLAPRKIDSRNSEH